jgi:hypothetical protein
MTTASQFATPDSGTSQTARTRRVYLKLGVVMLLVAIAGFSTLAKNSQYFSRSNPAHYINISSKMTVSHSPAALDPAPLHPIARFVPPQPATRTAQVVREEIPALPSIGVTVSLQHRSPPISLS